MEQKILKVIEELKKERRKLQNEIVDIKNQLIVANTMIENLKIDLYGEGVKNYVNRQIWH